MTTMVSAAVGAMVAALSAGTPVASQIARVRLRPLAATQALAVVVRPLQSEAGVSSMSPDLPVSWISAISVECYARTSAATTPDVAVDALVEAVYARLMADTTLGGVVLSLAPQSITWDFDADGEQTACATLVFQTLQRAQGAAFS